MFAKYFVILMTALFLIVSTACNYSETDSANGAGKSSENVEKESSGAPASEAPRVLEAKWYMDADGNAVPDFVETEIGYDPATDDCDPLTKCGAGASGADLDARPQNILLMLDSSGSMKASSGGSTSKIDAAKKALNSYVSNAPAKVRFGFLVYGHKGSNEETGKAESCAGIDILAQLGGIDKANISNVLGEFEPVGYTPIGASLEKAREAFANQENADNRIILVSDGIETCGGDPVAEAKKLHEEGFKVIVDVVGFDVSSNDAAQLKKIAAAGGGSYFDAKTQADLDDWFKKQGEAVMKSLTDSNCNIQVYNDAWLCDSKLATGAMMKINETLQAENIQPSGATLVKWEAYHELKERIRQTNEERRETYEGYRRRSQELFQQGKETIRQTKENYDEKIKPQY